jgi:hypothetical protein
LRKASDSDVKWLEGGQQCKNNRDLRTYIMLHQNLIPQQAFHWIKGLPYYPTRMKMWFAEIFEKRSSGLRFIGGGPASKNKLIQHDHIWRLKRSANTSVVAATSGFADSAG